ncbi:hypothetical protein J1N35_026184 [Gossypium stocksii]|uniref:Uncharacterized protein n=1 Tax=Gossypium stocksii TaxID=47602 RepID=A0A9D3V8W2_9ROSI|nr:hypothetical protein J1N35_026184 [Gossypium stocksii]
MGRVPTQNGVEGVSRMIASAVFVDGPRRRYCTQFETVKLLKLFDSRYRHTVITIFFGEHCNAVEVAAAGLAYSRSVVAAIQLGKQRSGQYFIRVQLHPPRHEWYKPNPDGAVKQRIGRPYAGGLIEAIGF